MQNLKKAHAEIMQKWEELHTAINELSKIANHSAMTLAYVDNVYDESTDEYRMYNEICETAEYIEIFSRYFVSV